MGTPTRVAVLGAGRHALETSGYLREAGIEAVAFVEEMPPSYERDAVPFGAPIYTFADALTRLEALPVLSAVGSPQLRRALVERWPGDEHVVLASDKA